MQQLVHLSSMPSWLTHILQGPNASYIVGGFVCAAVTVVLILAGFNSNSASARIAKNKAKHDRPSRSSTNELGSGDIAKKHHIQRWLEKKDKYDTLLPVRDVRGSDGIACKQGYLVLPREERNRHVLVIAKTGSGKTTRIILPVLYSDCMNPERSTIVLDSKPEMWDQLAGMTRKYCPEKKIVLFNPLDTYRSLSWNILAKIESDTDAKLIANTLISATDTPTAKSDSPFFRNNALQLLNAIMVGLVNDPNENLSMPRVHELVHGGMQNLCNWLEVHPQAIRNSKTFVDLARSGSQNADTILSELGMRIAAWDLTAIRATTAKNEFDLETLVSEPTLFIIELRESELEMLRPMANVIVVEVLRYLTKRAEISPRQTLPRPVSLVIDEFASALGRLPDIHVKLNTLRSRNVSVVAAIQSIAQIKANYEKDADSVLAGFSTKILMPALDFQDAEWASKETGTMTVRFNVASTGKNKRLIDYWSHKNENVQEQVQQRAVLTPDEIGRPADNVATFFMPNTPVFQGHLVPFFEVPEMTKRFAAGKKVEFQLRETPIDYEEHYTAPAPASAAAAQAAQPAAVVLEQLAQIKPLIGFAQATSEALEWWAALEQANQSNPGAVLLLAQQLNERGISVSEFYQIFAASGSDNVDSVLDQIDHFLLNELKTELGWEHTNQHAREWWIAFEEANKDKTLIIVQLAKELQKRQVTIDDFFSAYVHSDFDTIPEILKVIDYMLSQKQLIPRSERRAEVPEKPKQAAVEAQPQFEPQPIQPRQEARSKIVKSGHTVTLSDVPPGELAFELDGAASNAASASVNGSGKAEAKESKNNSNGTAHSEPAARNNKTRTRSVHFDTCYEMAVELLEQGKTGDYETLVALAHEDKRFSPDDVAELESLKRVFKHLANR